MFSLQENVAIFGVHVDVWVVVFHIFSRVMRPFGP